MEQVKSLDKLVKLIAVMLNDIQMSHSVTFSKRALRLTILKIESRTAREGIGFLTKTLPRLGKALDSALACKAPLNAAKCGFSSAPGCEYPRFLGELFSAVLTSGGSALADPCVTSIKHLRDILFVFYKLDVPYASHQEQKVIDQFLQTEKDIIEHDRLFNACSCSKVGDTVVDSPVAVFASNNNASLYASQVAPYHSLGYLYPGQDALLPLKYRRLVRKAQALLYRVFESFDPMDIVPRHGPGAVSTRERLWDKYTWRDVPDKLTKVYPLDAFFYASIGHVCDEYRSMNRLSDQETPARVILVPKDSRGPRLISCEPLYNQWIQQGLGRAIMHHVEHNVASRYNVFFSDQGPNQRGALLGSLSGKYSTLDLKEASDRVSLGLVRLLFPDHLVKCFESCRSEMTELPNGDRINLHKFAPMGSALCFPILALTVWSLLSSSVSDADTREGILVYGDDVIVPTAIAADAIETLSFFGLQCNLAKCCTDGFFRESCGVDAYKGICVTPLRLRKGLPSHRHPGLYPSSIGFANALYDRGYYLAFEHVRSLIHQCYGRVPSDDMHLCVPSLREVLPQNLPNRSRINHSLQKREWLVQDIQAPKIRRSISGWKMLLRYFTEGGNAQPDYASTRFGERGSRRELPYAFGPYDPNPPFCSSAYTKRDTIKIVKRWR